MGGEKIVFSLSAVQEDNPAAGPMLERRTAAQAFRSVLRDLLSMLSQSPTGRALLRPAVMRGVSVGLDPLLDAQTSFYYPQHKRLDLGYLPLPMHHTHKGLAQYLLSFCGGLRRIWQQSRGYAPDPLLRPEDFLKYSRAFEADVIAVTHLMAWELRAVGPCFFWRHLLAGPDSDVTSVFASAAAAHPRHQFDGTALRAAFLQWFQTAERVDACDHFSLECMDMALLAAWQNGARIGQRSLDFGDMVQLGVMPQGINYLSGLRFRSPAMRRGCDPFNRTHLLHIQRDLSYLIEKQKSF